MESRVRFIVVGLFTSVVAIAGFLFVLWIHTSGGLSKRRSVEIEFNGGAPGLRPGSAVTFNGVRVGEVVSVAFDPVRPQVVDATVSVENAAPLRVDTRIDIESEGLLGATAVALYGQSADAPLLAQGSGAKLSAAATSAAMSEEARRALTAVKTLVNDNASDVKDLVKNIDVFSAALARNSNRVDDLFSGIAQLLGRGPKPPAPKLFDLTAPSDFPAGEKAGFGQVVVAEVSAPVTFDTQRVLSRDVPSGPIVIGDTQWIDSLPKLVQQRVVETLEHAHHQKTVSKPFDQNAADYQLLIDIRRFDISAPDMQAIVELSVRLVSKEGRIVDARLFADREPASSRDGPDAARALDKAFGATAVALVDWFDNLKP